MYGKRLEYNNLNCRGFFSPFSVNGGAVKDQEKKKEITGNTTERCKEEDKKKKQAR